MDPQGRESRAALGPAGAGQEGVKAALSAAASWWVWSAGAEPSAERAWRNPGRSRGAGERAQTSPRPGAGGIGPAGGQPGSRLPPGSPSRGCQAASQPVWASVRSALPAEMGGIFSWGEIGGRAPAQIKCHPAQREAYSLGIPEGE